MDRYAQARAKPATDERGDWPLFLKGYFRNFIIYGVLAFGVILLGVRVLLPYLAAWMSDRSEIFGELAACGVIYLVLAVLLAAMLRVPKRYWLEGLSNRVLLSILLLFRMAVTVLLAVLPAFLIFQVNPLFLSLAAVPVVILIARSNKLAGRYLEVEARFLANFNERKLAEQGETRGAGPR